MNNKKIKKAIQVRRLFKEDMDKIIESYSFCNKLYFNPINKEFVLNVLLSGEFWGAFDNDNLIAVNWFFDAQKNFFEDYIANWEFKDLVNENLNDYLIAGYIYSDDYFKDKGIYNLMNNIWTMQALKMNKKFILHYTPVKCWCDLPALFSNSFILKGLRGLDNLVLHYIFIKKVSFNKMSLYTKDDAVVISINESKKFSYYLENGYVAFDVNNIGEFYLKKEI